MLLGADTDTLTDRHTYRDRQTDRHTHTHTSTHIHTNIVDKTNFKKPGMHQLVVRAWLVIKGYLMYIYLKKSSLIYYQVLVTTTLFLHTYQTVTNSDTSNHHAGYNI